MAKKNKIISLLIRVCLCGAIGCGMFFVPNICLGQADSSSGFTFEPPEIPLKNIINSNKPHKRPPASEPVPEAVPEPATSLEAETLEEEIPKEAAKAQAPREDGQAPPPFPFPIPKSDLTEGIAPGMKQPRTVVKSIPKIAAPAAPEDAIDAPEPKKEVLSRSDKGYKPPRALEAKPTKESIQGAPVESAQLLEEPGQNMPLELGKSREPQVSEPVEKPLALEDEFDPEPRVDTPEKPKEEVSKAVQSQIKTEEKILSPGVEDPAQESKEDQAKEGHAKDKVDAPEPAVVPKEKVEEAKESKAPAQEPKESQKSPPTLPWVKPDPTEDIDISEFSHETPVAIEAPAAADSKITQSSEEVIEKPNVKAKEAKKEDPASHKEPPTLPWTAPEKKEEILTTPLAPKEERKQAPEENKSPVEDTPVPMTPPEQVESPEGVSRPEKTQGHEVKELPTPTRIEEQSIEPEESIPTIESIDEPIPEPEPQEIIPSPLDPGAVEDAETREYLEATATILEELSLLMTRAPSLSLAQYDPSDTSAPLAPSEVLRQIESLSRRLRILDSKTFSVIPPNKYLEYHNKIRNSIVESRLAFEAVMTFFNQGDSKALQEMRNHITKARDLIRQTRRRS